MVHHRIQGLRRKLGRVVPQVEVGLPSLPHLCGVVTLVLGLHAGRVLGNGVHGLSLH